MSDMESTAAPVNVSAANTSRSRSLRRAPARWSSTCRSPRLVQRRAGLADVSLDIRKNEVTAFIGPSGCGKSTFIRCFNRLNDLIPTARVEGQILYHGQDLYGSDVDPVEVRKLIGMVFQKPNPFPKSIYDNVAFGPRVLGKKGRRSRRARAP